MGQEAARRAGAEPTVGQEAAWRAGAEPKCTRTGGFGLFSLSQALISY